MTDDERMQREANLIATIRAKLPDFARMCADDTELVMLHQVAFAADYQEDEYLLLGMAIKYAGLRGKEVHVIGKNRSSLAEEERITSLVDLTSMRRQRPSRRRCKMSTFTSTPPCSNTPSKIAGISGLATNSRVVRVA